PASAEVSGVPLSAGHRAFAVVVDISGPAFGSRCWEALDAHGAEYHSDELDGHWRWHWRCHWDCRFRLAWCSSIEEADCNSLLLGGVPLGVGGARPAWE